MLLAVATKASSKRDDEAPLQRWVDRSFDVKAPHESKIFESGDVIKTEMTKKLKEI